MTTRAGEGEKFVNFALGSGKGKCDEVVSFPKDGDGKGNKTLVPAHSGYAVELVGVVDGTEKALLAKESGLRGNLDKAQENLKTIAEAKAALPLAADGMNQCHNPLLSMG